MRGNLTEGKGTIVKKDRNKEKRYPSERQWRSNMVIIILVSTEACNQLRNMVVFFITLLRASCCPQCVEPHRDTIHAHQGGWKDDWWLATAFCVFISDASLNFWRKQPWQAAGSCIKSPPFSRLITTELVCINRFCSQLWTVIRNKQGKKHSTLSPLMCFSPEWLSRASTPI